LELWRGRERKRDRFGREGWEGKAVIDG